jgi:hypothetical protein
MPNFMYWLITCSVINCLAGQKLHACKLSEVNAKCIQILQQSIEVTNRHVAGSIPDGVGIFQ